MATSAEHTAAYRRGYFKGWRLYKGTTPTFPRRWPQSLRVLLLVVVCASGLVEAVASDVYKVTVTRKDQDLYEVQGGNVYIKTRFCYEYVFSDEAILRIDSTAGYSIGKIFYNGGASCDVEKVLR